MKFDIQVHHIHTLSSEVLLLLAAVVGLGFIFFLVREIRRK